MNKGMNGFVRLFIKQKSNKIMATGTLNKVMLIGHTGDDVKMHYFEGGGAIGRFPLATNESYVNKQSGERVNNTEWHNCVVRNKGAEICEKYLKKGDKVYVEGRIKTRKWQDDQGNERYSTEIHVTDFTFLTPKGESGGDSGRNGSAVDSYMSKQKSGPENAGNEFLNGDFKGKNAPQDDEDDLPF